MNRYTFTFRPLRENDLPLLAEWLSRPHLQQWWRKQELTVKQVREKYLPRISGAADARPFLVCMEDRPVGYIQYYRAAAGDAGWWPDTPGEGVLGIDQFIADVELLNRGIGTAFIRQFVTLLAVEYGATQIRVDPKPDNLRAIRSYTKAGFRPVGEITTPDGPALMMVLDV